MAATAHKDYFDESLCCKALMENHFSHPQISFIEESMSFPLRVLHELFSKGKVKANKALDFSIGSSILQLLSLSNVCKEIYMVRLKDDSIEQINQWLKSGKDAVNWSYVTKRVCHLEGNKQGWKEKEEQLKKAIKGVYKLDKSETQGIDPSLVPEVDCVTSLFILNVISKSKDEFKKYLEKFKILLEPGGHLVLFAVLNMTFYQVGEQRYHCLKLEETEVQEMVVNSGLVIEKSIQITGMEHSNDMVDYEQMCAVIARSAK